jgi:hypothetical protein
MLEQDVIQYVEGDLFKSLDDVTNSGMLVVIPHVVNDEKVWGAGFVMPLAQRFPQARDAYLGDPGLKLGDTQFVTVARNVIVANMVAQSFGQEPPLRYDALDKCLIEVARKVDGEMAAAHSRQASWSHAEIRCPLFGAGIAGGDWVEIEKMICERWRGLTVGIYYLPQFLPPSLKPPPAQRSQP